MRRLLPLLLLMLMPALPALAQQPPPDASRFFPYALKTTQLPNGLTVVRVPFNSPGIVAYVTAVRVGSRNEVEPGRTGFAHFFEHMMFKGTKANPEGQRERILGGFGFDDNAFTTDDITVYQVYGPSAGLEKLIALEADRFQNLEYSEPAFQTEALAVLGEYHKNAAGPDLKLEESLVKTAFTRHTYQHTTLGFYEDIQAMPKAYAYSRAFFERWYTPSNTTLFIVGDFNDAQVLAQVTQAYGGWQRKPTSVIIPTEPEQTSPRSVHVDWPQPTQPRHVLAWHTPAARADTPDAAIQSILAEYLAGDTSPAYKELVLEKQYAESINVYTTPHRDPYLFPIDVTLQDEQHRAAVDAVLRREVTAVTGAPVDPVRLRAIQDHLRYGLLMDLETPRDVAIDLALYAGVMGRPDALASYLKQLGSVTPQQLTLFARKYFKDSNLTVLTLTPKAVAAGGTP
ncbi:insulinase family protein [Corallococcus sp. AB049A]|uniref:Insulinase family protein n=1 Tax=Corallococcus interemptor TaxID=2316720 RepID=A0A3A8QHN0_9BACT|nr:MULTISPECIES: pitrilysin family protein [Corallococcus]RKH44098.1 insulinase family protein [Corallococcus sp. AB050B]RKH67428.1 insulinase family protein [Corallococcus interemptor]RKI50134.1 insulinase family protein [Corallococcus sp. AB049A]